MSFEQAVGPGAACRSSGAVMSEGNDVIDDATFEVGLPAQLDQKAAYALAETLLAERGRAVRLNGGSVLRLGGQCLQVMLAARRAWEEDSQALTIMPCSEELAAGLSLLGAAEIFGVDTGESA
jgi:chemotaxis protein CheX